MRRLALTAAVSAAALIGCGNERTRLPGQLVDPSFETRPFAAPGVGLKLRLAANLQRSRRKPPGVLRASLADAFVSVFAYRRKQDLPNSDDEQRDALRRLRRETKRRSDAYRPLRGRLLRVDGARAVELVGEQTAARARLRIRSLHVYRGEVEYVIEVAAPPRSFRAIDSVTTPLIRRTLDVTGKTRRRPASDG